MQTTMTIQENGVFIPVPQRILEKIKANHATQINYDYSSESGFSVTPISTTRAKKPALIEDNFESEDLFEVLKELAKRNDLKISPEVAKLAGSLKPYIGLSDDEIDEEELAFLQAIKEDDMRIKSYYSTSQ